MGKTHSKCQDNTIASQNLANIKRLVKTDLDGVHLHFEE